MTIANVEFGARQALMLSYGLPVPEINHMPFICTKCAEDDRVSGAFPQAACLKFCTQATINNLFNKLRKFQLLNGDPSQQQSETEQRGEPLPTHQLLWVYTHCPLRSKRDCDGHSHAATVF